MLTFVACQFQVEPPEQTILALHMGHDSSIAITRNGRVKCILELEPWQKPR